MELHIGLFFKQECANITEQGRAMGPFTARTAIALLVSAWIGVAYGQQANSVPASTSRIQGSSSPVDEAAQQQLLQEAVTQIKSGLNAEAINGPLAQIIHTYETAYAHSTQRVYCAESIVEAMLYLTQAAHDGQSARVLPKPTWALAYYFRGYAYGSLGDTTEAEASLKQALALSPSNSQFLSELANAFEHQKDWPNALKTFQDADAAAINAARPEVKIPLRCRALRGQGYVLVELHRLDDATQKYQECLGINPGDQASMRELGYIQGLRNQTTK
jgi:tetratricopeptide (TPR) repeat protein